MRNSIAFKHLARSLVARQLRIWRYAVQMRFWLQHANTVALRHWACARQLHSWRAWRWAVWAELSVCATRTKRAHSVLWRSLEAWAEHTPFVGRMARGQSGREHAPSLVEWAFCAKYRDTRQLAICVDTWTTHMRCKRRGNLQRARAWQHRQYALMAEVVCAWQAFIKVSKHTRNAYRMADKFRLKAALGAWVHAQRQHETALHAKTRALMLSRVRGHMQHWRTLIKTQRAVAAADWSFSKNLQNLIFAKWRRAAHLAGALRAMDEIAIGVSLSRLAQKSIDGWVSWRSIQLQKQAILRATIRHHHAAQTSGAILRWHKFVSHRARRCRLKRQARQHRRSRVLRRAFGTWLCYLARLDKEYAALQLALQTRRRSYTRAAFVGWQQFKTASQARRLQFLHAEGFREAVLLAGVLSRWCEAIAMRKHASSQFTAACKHADVQLQCSMLCSWSQAAQLSATLRWAKHSRLSSLRASLDMGRLRRSWHVWTAEVVTTARAKATLRNRALSHLSVSRLRKCIAMLSTFLAQRRWAHRKWSAAVHQVRNPHN